MFCDPTSARTTNFKFADPFVNSIFVRKFNPHSISHIRTKKHFFKSAG